MKKVISMNKIIYNVLYKIDASSELEMSDHDGWADSMARERGD